MITFKELYLYEGLASRISFTARSAYDTIAGHVNPKAAQVKALRKEIHDLNKSYDKVSEYVRSIKTQRSALIGALQHSDKRHDDYNASRIKGYLKRADKQLEFYVAKKNKLEKQIDEKVGRVHILMGDSEGFKH